MVEFRTCKCESKIGRLSKRSHSQATIEPITVVCLEVVDSDIDEKSDEYQTSLSNCRAKTTATTSRVISLAIADIATAAITNTTTATFAVASVYKVTTFKNAIATKPDSKHTSANAINMAAVTGEEMTAELPACQKRRRCKTVHFIEKESNELIDWRIRGHYGSDGGRVNSIRSLDRCGAAVRKRVLSLPNEFDQNVRQLFTFIGSVLSACDTGSLAAENAASSTSVSISVSSNSNSSCSSGSNNSSSSSSRRLRRLYRRHHLSNCKSGITAGDDSKNFNETTSIRIRKRGRDALHLPLCHNQRTFNITEQNVGCHLYRHTHWKIASRTCDALFLKKMSYDDRTSLTTAVSDEDDIGESLQNLPFSRARKTNSVSFNCTGAVRKAGFLSVKKWLLRKKKQIEPARKSGWKGYWVCLKGTTLLFYRCDSPERHSPEAAPKHLIIVDGAIMQPVPEHPKRDYIFCLSTAFGDAYLFQAPCQVELENWINGIHSACAAAFARYRGKTGTFHVLSEEVFKVEKALELDHKMKHMVELQLSVISDTNAQQQLSAQIVRYEENMERLYCEQFRLRCYISSLQNGELPNPKNLLTNVSRPTKHALNMLGVFTVSSFHAYICSRSPSLLNNLLAGRSSIKRQTPMLSRSKSVCSRRSLSTSFRDEERTVKVCLPDNQSTQIYLKDAMTVEEYIASACIRKNLNAMQHFVRVKKRRDMEDHNYFVPHRSDMIERYLNTHEIVEICVKVLYQVELVRSSVDHMWGFSVEAELIENIERQDELCVWVSRVEDKGTALLNGIIKGDEIMVINSSIVSDLDMMYIESVLQEELCLCMMMRSSRIEPPSVATTASILKSTDDIDSLVCPPPPTDRPIISEEMISGLIVPAPCYGKDQHGTDRTDLHRYACNKVKIACDQTASVSSAPPKDVPASHQSTRLPSADHVTADKSSTPAKQQPSRAGSLEIENLVKTAGENTGFCRLPVNTERCSATNNQIVQNQASAVGTLSAAVIVAAEASNKILTEAEKLRKVILELIETERTYVKHLNNMLESYLEPLKNETFLTTAEIIILFGNILEIVDFQRQFSENLDNALSLETGFYEFEHPAQFKNIVFSIGSAFLYHVDHFKLYSLFCASHSKAQKILNPNEGNNALQEFLAARNPRQQHSSTLESYLIKPIQRILKYPLLLQQLRNLTDPASDEHVHLVEALRGMEKVAEHINEMQRIHEEYGAIFDHLFRQHEKPIDLSSGDLMYYGGVEWINISDFIGKIKKGLELHAMCFVFKSAVIFLCKERIRQKKKLMGVSTNKREDVEIIRYQVLIPVTNVQVRTIAKEGEDHFLWELVHMRCHPLRHFERVYLLSNSTNDFRNAFIKTIRQTIRESVRNMNIPGNRGSMVLTATTTASVLAPLSLLTSAAGKFGATITPRTSKDTARMEERLRNERSWKTKDTDSDGDVNGGSTAGKNVVQAGAQIAQTVIKSKKIPPKPPQRCSSTVTATAETRANESSGNPLQKQANSKQSEFDPGTKSESEEDNQCSTVKEKSKPCVGKTPNYLILSTASTLSTDSTVSQARLIQSSQHPKNYQPTAVKDSGSPIWKPRDIGESLTLPRKSKTPSTSVDTRTLVRKFNSKNERQKL